VSHTALWTPVSPSLGPAVAAIGVFDGVHIGHAALVADAVRIARMKEAAAVVVTFDRDPDQVVSPLSAAPQLTDLQDKLAFLAELGPDTVVVVPFDASIAAMAPLVFLDEVLLRAMTPLAAVVGYDFRFGHRAEGDVDTLVRYGAGHGFTVIAHELVNASGEPVTSTRIRALVATGEMEAAAALLGSRGEGAALGAPTANVRVGPYAALPGDGVYAGRAIVNGVTYAAGISAGAPPTFPEAGATLEAHLVGFTGDIYGSDVVLEFVSRLRDLERFGSQSELAEAIRADLDRVRGIVSA
jgi:riboflavin kinase/FMN adenylyltransferase